MEAQFSYLDLNGSGAIDYTEFCAAGLGESVLSKVEMAGTAFRALDVDTTGKLTVQQLQDVLISKDMQGTLGQDVCEMAADEVMQGLGAGETGEVDVDDWMGVVRRVWTERQ